MLTKKILVVDDEEPVRALVAATLGMDERYQLMEAKNGLEALEVARREKPALVLLDILMPGLDWFEVCRRLKADPETKQIAIIILSALVQEKDKSRAQQAGANGFFSKPFSPTTLLGKVDEVLGQG